MRFLIVVGMLMLAVSASLTPANAAHSGRAYCDNEVCLCQFKCDGRKPHGVVGLPHYWPGGTIPSQVLACRARCGSMQGTQHLSPLKAKEAAQH
jgi:hypothetical protein